ncbi:uncharacterized protein LOC131946226 [Physella acuta]|uniref:uncharacterized protein LOC131946226 n=1 Tax=Physella acuta TaxID=109671 RepID=UPI0027DD558D|nr:uncharacterized protein LOC131946226 [Physella acuta]
MKLYTVFAAAVLSVYISFGFSTPHCPQSWFGDKCQYMCHCLNQVTCDSDSGCLYGCQPGWFGPGCQYEDIRELATSGKEACTNPDNVTNYRTITWKIAYPVSWVRVRTVYRGSADGVRVRYKRQKNSKSWVNFPDKKVFVDSDTIDFFSLQAKMVISLQLVIDRKTVCQIHVTGGRNVAIKQATRQSSFLGDEGYSGPQKAVDGSRVNDFDLMSCTHSDHESTFPVWEVNLKPSALVSRYQLYNRDSFMDRLQQFRLRGYDGDKMVFEYKDNSTREQSVYIVTSNSSQVVSRVAITAERRENQFNVYILTLCEVEIYGEPDCPAVYYGLDCEKRCNCKNKTEVCVVSTGGCVSGCPAGRYSEECKFDCEPTYYDDGCEMRCPISCVAQLCDPVTGECFKCVPGFLGQFCNQTCPAGSYGYNCSQNCSEACGGDGNCNHSTGACLHGCVDGYQGDDCQICK